MYHASNIFQFLQCFSFHYNTCLHTPTPTRVDRLSQLQIIPPVTALSDSYTRHCGWSRLQPQALVVCSDSTKWNFLKFFVHLQEDKLSFYKTAKIQGSAFTLACVQAPTEQTFLCIWAGKRQIITAVYHNIRRSWTRMVKGETSEKWAEWALASLLKHGHPHKFVLKEKCLHMLLTAPERNIFALSFHDDRWHRHGDRDGIKVRRVGGYSEDGCFCR